jgi:hypothetical protein
VTVYRSAINKPVFTFADQASSSVRRTANRAAPFRYTPLDPAAVTAASKVEIVSATSAQMNFLKDIYLAKGIAHTTGIANFLVLVDGCVAGGFIFARDRFVQDNRIYLLSDFALAPRTRLSKLVAMLATCELVIRLIEVRLVQRIDLIVTTAFTTQPVSMKYRGVFDLVSRKPGMLNYASKIRRQSTDDIYAEWFRRFAGNGGRKAQASPHFRSGHWRNKRIGIGLARC